MPTYSHTVMGVFPSRATAQSAVDAVEAEGFLAERLSVLARPEDQTAVTVDTSSHVAGSVAEGTTTGAALGGLAGLLAGLTALTVPGIGALFIAGPIALALGATGAAATAAAGTLTGVLAGGLLGGLMGLGLPKESAQVYEDRVKSGGIVLAVSCANEIEANGVQKIMNENGVERIDILHAQA